MASERPRGGNQLLTPTSLSQRNDEIGFIDISKEASNGISNSIDTLDDSWPPFPYFQTADSIFPYYPKIGYDNLHELGSDISFSWENVIELGQYHGHCDSFPSANEMNVDTHGNNQEKSKIEREIETATGGVVKGFEIFSNDGETNGVYLHGPLPIGNGSSCGGRTPVSRQDLPGGDIRINNWVTSAVQPSHPPILDGNFLNLGVGSNTETGLNFNISSRDSTNVGVVLPPLDMAFGQKNDGSSLNPCLKMDGLFSSGQNNVSGFTSLVQKDGGFSSLAQDTDGFSLLGRTIGGVSHSVQTVNGFSNLAPNVGGILGQAQNVGPFSHRLEHLGGFSHQSQNDSGFSTLLPNFGGISGSVQNVHGFSHQALDVNELSTLVPNFGVISGSPENVGRFCHQAQNVDTFSRILQNVDQFPRSALSEGGRTMPILVGKQHYPHIPNKCNFGLVQDHHAGFAGVDPNMGFQGVPVESLVVQNSNQVAMPGYGPSTSSGLQPFCSLAGSTIQGTSDQLENCHMGIIKNFSSEHSLDASSVEVTKSNVTQELSAGRPFWANEIRAALAAEDGLSSRNSGVPRARNLGQSLAAVPVQHSISLGGPSYNSGQEILAASRSAQASDLPLGLALKRVTTESPHSDPEAQNRKTRKMLPSQVASPHTSLSLATDLIPPIAQTAQLCPAQIPLCPPLASVTPSRPSLAKLSPSQLPLTHTSRPRPCLVHTSRPHPRPRPPRPRPRPSLIHTSRARPSLAHTAPHLPSLSKTRPSFHVKWQDPEETRRPSGYQCQICKRDLSFTPEGPVYQPANPPPTAVLPCKHHFHAHCLELITADNQGQTPPCIPCALEDRS